MRRFGDDTARAAGDATPARLWAVRHAPAQSTGVCYGRRDVPVDRSPLDAATHIEARWSGVRVDRLHSSPAARCWGVAEVLAERLRAPLTTDPRLMELSFGEWEGRRWDDLHQECPEALARWSVSYETVAPPGGETSSALAWRVRGFVLDLEPDARHLIVTHAGVIRALWALGGACSFSEALARPVPHLEPLPMPDDSHRGAARAP